MLRNLDPPSIPSNGGRNRVEMLSVHTGQREVAKTGSLSLAVKNAKRMFFDDKIHEIMNKSRGPWELMNWVKKRKLPAIEAIKHNALVSLLRVYGMLYTILSTQRFIAKLTSKFLTNLHKNHLRIGVLFLDLSSYQRLANVLTHLCLDQIG